jgi:uncharacterized SAM-binding protein YcdF (DUF218 family)
MNGGWVATNAVSALLLPPLNLVIPAVIGLLLRRRWPRTGLALGVTSLALLLLFSTRAGAYLLLRPLENLTAPLTQEATAGAQAIVVLGGGRISASPEEGGHDSVNPQTLARLRYAARLQRTTGLPLLVSGGKPDGAAESEAQLMARSLRDDFAVPVRWLEQDSDNTAQNAFYSKRQLQHDGVTRVLLVTDAMHMPRAQAIFDRAGLAAVAAPTRFLRDERFSAIYYVPDGEGLRRSHYALHEWLGLLWYRLRHGDKPSGMGDGMATKAMLQDKEST